MKKLAILLAASLALSPLETALAQPATVVPAPVANPRWEAHVQRNIEDARLRAEQIALVFDGDSITDWWEREGVKTWNERYAPLGVVDFGIAGDRTQNVLWRISQGQLKGLKPKMVAIMIGTNNIGTNSEEDIAAGVAAIVAEYRKSFPDAVILLQGVFPRGEKADNPARAIIRGINERIAKLASPEQKVIYLDFGAKFLRPDGTISREIMPDFLHLSEKGYEIWAEAIQPTLNQVFPKQ